MKNKVRKQKENSANACLVLTPSNSLEVMRSRKDTAKAYVPMQARRPERNELKGKDPPMNIYKTYCVCQRVGGDNQRRSQSVLPRK
jgi:hypothetical protein